MDAAVVIDQDRLGAGIGDEAGGPGRSPPPSRLGQDFGLPTSCRQHAGRHRPAGRRLAGGRVDQVVQTLVADAPATPQHGGGGDGTVVEVDGGDRMTGGGGVEVDAPGVAAGRHPRGSQVSTQVHEGPGGALVADAGRHQVGRQALADAAGIEPHPGGDQHRVAGAVDQQPMGSLAERRVRAAVAGRRGGDEVEGTVIAGADHVTEHGGVIAAAGHVPGLDGPGHQLLGLRRDHRPPPGPFVDEGHLAVGQEPAPTPFQILDQLPCRSGQLGRSVDDDVGVAAHGSEPHGQLPLLVVWATLWVEPEVGVALVVDEVVAT